MAVVIPQVITEDRAAAPSVATGSFVFPDNYGHHKLSRYVASSGNTGTYTVSMWVKLNQEPTTGQNPLWSASPTTDNNNYYGLYIGSDQLRYHNANASTTDINGSNKLRDRNSWYHIHTKVDSNTAQCYINGEAWGGTFTLNGGWWNNSSYRMDIGSQAINNGVTGSVYAAYQFAQVYNIDGQALGPEYFGHTDPLTGVWSPKPFDISDTPGGSWGTNGFYLPMDGKNSITEDQSPNNIKFVNTYFTSTASQAAGSLSNHVSLDKATGAIPILKTDPSGQVMSGGVRTHKITYKVTVVNDGGNKYFLNGVNYTGTTIPMYRGGVYEFDQSDSSNATHPLRFATAADAAGSTEYTDGVQQSGTPGQSGAYTRITVPHNAPDTLYYYCTNHGGMGGPTANTTDIHVADPYAWKCVLAVPFNDFNDGSIYYGIQNYCHTGRPDCINPYGGAETYITPYNSVSNQGRQFNYYGGSRTFDGPDGTTGGDYMLFQSWQTTEAGDALAFGTGDFTVEFWANFEDMGADSSSAVLSTSTTSQNAGSWIIGFHGSAGAASFGWCYDVPNFTWLSARIDGYFHSWHHYAFQREGSTFKIFIDGVQATYTTDSVNYNYVPADGKIGQRWINSDAYSLNAEIQDLRVYKGVAKYNNYSVTSGSSAFLCGSTKPFFLPEVPKGTPYPGTLKKIEGGSIHCIATNANSYVQIPDSSDFDFGTGDFTVECFFYVEEDSGTNTAQCLISKSSTTFSTTTSSWWLRKAADNDIQFGFISGGAYKNIQLDKNWGFESRSWTHVAATRKSGVVKIFLNGIQCGSSTSYGTDMTGTIDVTTEPLRIGSNGSSLGLFKGYISNVRIVKGTALYDTSFNAPTEPLEVVNNTVVLCCQSPESVTTAAVTPGTLSKGSTHIGPSNFTPFINNILQMQGPENNYAVLEATRIKTHQVEVNMGGLELHGPTGSPWNTFPGTMGASSGKWYWEVYAKNADFSTIIGAAQDGSYHMWDTDIYPGQSSYGNAFAIQNNGTLRVNGTATGGWVAVHAASDSTRSTIGFALDMDAGKAYISINGVWGPDATPATNGMVSDGTATAAVTGLTGTYRPAIGLNGGTYNWDTLDVNFGQRPFRYAPPEGYKCWNRTNLPASGKAARNATKNFGVVTWTGDGTNGRDITGLEFQPDMVWIKRRNGANQHNLYDSVRGVTVHLTPDNTYPDQTTANSLTAFNSDGFQVGINASDNTSSSTYVAWCWKAGGAAVTNNDGSITSQVSANTDAGFSIVSYTGNLTAGATVGHGLNSAPEFIIVKNRDDVATNWECKHKDLSNDDMMLKLNNDDAQEDLNGWNNTAPTDTVFTLGAANGTNRSGDAFIAYCFHSVEGYCKAGKYIGNGNASGPVIYTEFKPAFVMTKRIDSNFGGEWSIFDNARNTTNPNNNLLAADLHNAETTADIDFLSNGFKLRMAGNWQNQGGGEYIYLAFAEAPTNAGFGAVTNAR